MIVACSHFPQPSLSLSLSPLLERKEFNAITEKEIHKVGKKRSSLEAASLDQPDIISWPTDERLSLACCLPFLAKGPTFLIITNFYSKMNLVFHKHKYNQAADQKSGCSSSD